MPRAYWPAITAESVPAEHPLICYRYGVCGSLALTRLRQDLANGPALAGGTPDEAPVRERNEARRQLGDARRQVADLEQQRDALQDRAAVDARRAREAERTLRAIQQQAPSDAAAADATEADRAFREAVHRAWLDAFGVADRNRWPLGSYLVHDDFVTSWTDACLGALTVDTSTTYAS